MIYPIGTYVQIRKNTEYYHQQFVSYDPHKEKLNGVVVNNEYDGDGEEEYIYKVEWELEGGYHSSNYYRIEDLEESKNISQVRNFKKEENVFD